MRFVVNGLKSTLFPQNIYYSTMKYDNMDLHAQPKKGTPVLLKRENNYITTYNTRAQPKL